MISSRKIAAQALCRVEDDGGYSNIVIGNFLNDFNLSKEDKSLASALFYGVLDRKITLDFYIGKLSKIKPKKLDPLTRQALRIGIYQIAYMEKIPVRAAVNESVNIVKNTPEQKNSGFINAILRGAAENLPSLPDTKDLFSLSVRYSCPVWIISELLSGYGADTTEKILNAYLFTANLNVCVNTVKTSAKELNSRFKNDGTRAELLYDNESFNIIGGIDFKNNSPFNEGLFYVQDMASKNCAKAIKAVKGERVLDVCAAPGGKSFTMALSMENEGEIVSCDLYENRVSLIKSGAQRLGLSCIKPQINDALIYNKSLGEFDAVLCDVPCSGFGVIRRKPEIKYKGIDDFKELEKIQKDILEISSKYVKQGGRLLYSTCTLRKNENENRVAEFLKSHADFKCEYMQTDLPGEDGDGFFHALLIKD